MNKYSLDFDKKASKDLLSLDKSVRNFILDELENFINNFDEDYEKELNLKTILAEELLHDYIRKLYEVEFNLNPHENINFSYDNLLPETDNH